MIFLSFLVTTIYSSGGSCGTQTGDAFVAGAVAYLTEEGGDPPFPGDCNGLLDFIRQNPDLNFTDDVCAIPLIESWYVLEPENAGADQSAFNARIVDLNLGPLAAAVLTPCQRISNFCPCSCRNYMDSTVPPTKYVDCGEMTSSSTCNGEMTLLSPCEVFTEAECLNLCRYRGNFHVSDSASSGCCSWNGASRMCHFSESEATSSTLSLLKASTCTIGSFPPSTSPTTSEPTQSPSPTPANNNAAIGNSGAVSFVLADLMFCLMATFVPYLFH